MRERWQEIECPNCDMDWDAEPIVPLGSKVRCRGCGVTFVLADEHQNVCEIDADGAIVRVPAPTMGFEEENDR